MQDAECLWSLWIGQAMREVQRGSSGAESAVVRLVNGLIDQSIAWRVSDLHLEPMTGGMRVRYRRDGILQEDDRKLPRGVEAAVVSRIKVMAGMDIAQRQRPQDGHIRYVREGQKTLDIRVASMPVTDGEMMVLRFMNLEDEMLKVSELGFSEKNRQKFEKLIHAPAGLLVICGPMNSGKTTSLYAAMNALNVPECSLITLEDPVERELSGINQVQMNPKAGLDYVTGLRAVLRQDVEKVLLGEIRDGETAEMAVRIALTGHLLMTTLHTEDATAVIYRLLDMGVKPYLLAATLSGIVAQRLVRCICPECRSSYVVEEGSRDAALLGDCYEPGLVLWHGTGCNACGGTGYQGRMALQEVLIMDDSLRQALLHKCERQEFSRIAAAGGMESLWQDGIQKVKQGVTTLTEVRRVLYGN